LYILFALYIMLGSCSKDAPSMDSTTSEKETSPNKDASSDTNIISDKVTIQIISTGSDSIDLDKDGVPDIKFEIINLNDHNSPPLPATLDSLAALAHPLTLQILDNSTHSYPDALTASEEINDQGHWTNIKGVLGTFTNAGQFKGNKENYLGLRFANNAYGWIKIHCSAHNDTLLVSEYGYTRTAGQFIKAGQK
jgi:hypothetical protein